MNIFDNYAEFYDLIYHDKDYQGESNYIDGLIKKYLIDAKSILELGCGTGRHALLLAEKGYHVCGVDVSEKMVEKAKLRLEKINSLKDKVNFLPADIRTVRLNKKFDVAISLYHVFSYQTKNSDLIGTLDAAALHLNKNGLLIFDCWYGPAVMVNLPEVRVRRVESNEYLITRVSEPKNHFNENVVDVHFDVFVQDKKSKQISEFKEVHNMRYFFKPELEHMFEASGFEFLSAQEWLTGGAVSEKTWGVCFVARKT
jgi:SAM-dependent methyltransferase